MKWFKYLTGTLDDPFIYGLLKEHGSKGYLVFFGTIELVAKECVSLDNFVTFSYSFCATKMQLSSKTLKKIYDYIALSGRFEYSPKGDNFIVRIPKLRELSDEYTKRIVRTNSEHATDFVRPRIRSKNKNTEEDKEIHKTVASATPTVLEVAEYCKERGNGIDPELFVDHYQARGWKLSNGRIVKDWRACVRTWEKNAFNKKSIAQEEVAWKQLG